MFRRKNKEVKKEVKIEEPRMIEYKIKYKVRFKTTEDKIEEITTNTSYRYQENQKVNSHFLASDIYSRLSRVWFYHPQTIVHNNKLYVIDEIYNIEVLEFEKVED